MICDDCDNDPDTCGYSPEECEEINREAWAESQFEAMRDARD
jgi:hypothetical protein